MGSRAGTISQLGRGVRYAAKGHVRLSDATAADLGIKPFGGARCELCKAGLYDTEGNPRWDFIGGRFICPVLTGCGGA